MNCQNDLDFLRDILKKCHVDVTVLSPLDSVADIGHVRLINIIKEAKQNTSIQKITGNIKYATKYKLTDEFKLRYIFLQVPVLNEKNILVVGPYLSSPVNSAEILEIGESLGISASKHKILAEYFASVPVLPENDRMFIILDAFCERIWGTASFATIEIVQNYTRDILPEYSAPQGEKIDEILENAKILEMRYSVENELITAVRLGQYHKEKMFASFFNENMFERRLQDVLRNAKNYCIIMNTLLRKASEQGGLHPFHIDILSSNFAKRIELAANTAETAELMKEMFSAYCLAVYQNNTQKYSAIVKKTLLIVDSDISSELSLAVLAKKQGVSPGYLATVFKKETSKTISEYIRDKRINHAMYLLNTTNLQIQTVAMHCGIMDVQYFSKMFKKQIGKSPKEYRESSKR